MNLKWTVDYGDGERPVSVPHVWHLERPVTWEGPAKYRTRFFVPSGQSHLVFHGVSYRAEVFVQGEPVLVHDGIWDAFAVEIARWAGQEVEVMVRVTKNGGPTFPVKVVASGFLPYVHHTFGGIFRPVELTSEGLDLEPPAPLCRVKVEQGRVFADGEPVYVRGILTWGWYPETSSPHPSVDVIERELDQIQAMGFNLVKFCLWLPPHAYLEALERRGMWAWIELPIWLPDPTHLDAMRDEALRIVSQYRRHSCILAWTAGCELSEGVDPRWRAQLVEDIRRLTGGHPLVKDNSGGAEMYGGHPAEFGTFEDFHPYCDTPYFPRVLECLAPGPREKRPTFLGETNDYDVFRPLHEWKDNSPYWASADPDLNDQGVRWQHDLPSILERCQGELGEWLRARADRLLASSLSQSAWMRQQAFDAKRMNSWLDGWVLTGHRHTPISSAGVVDDAGELVYPVETVRQWTADAALLLVPRRTPPWVDGGNRPGWEHPTVRFSGPCLFQVAVHSVTDLTGSLCWSLAGQGACVEDASVRALDTRMVGTFVVDLAPGQYELRCAFGGAERKWPVHVVDRLEAPPEHVMSGVGTVPRPFFREACYAWENWPVAVDAWDVLSLVAGDRCLDPAWLDAEHAGWEPLLIRLDTRTFERLPVVVRTGGKVVTSLRLGEDWKRNPAAHLLAESL